MEFGALAAFWLVSMMFVLTPGADWAYAIAAGIRGHAFPAVGGMLGGHLAATGVVATGIATVVAGSATTMTALTVAGACYVGWLGWATFTRPPTPQVGTVDGDHSRLAQLGKGFGVSALNPKVLLLFLALLPQFTSPDSGWPIGGQILLLGSVHVVSCAVIYFAVAGGARRVLQARPGAARVMGRISGVAMLVVAVALIAEQVYTLLPAGL
ncbi:LysE family translocator [Gordonia caeni]|uniref:LysE family transporter n=1 Tax=Gordonia caeni TaxID=1007097 RepID=A0ABP7NL21_9ACTN